MTSFPTKLAVVAAGVIVIRQVAVLSVPGVRRLEYRPDGPPTPLPVRPIAAGD